MKLSVKLALAMTALVAAVVVAAVLSIGAYLHREIVRQLATEIDRTGDVLAEVQRGRLERLASENRVLADEPRLKAVVNSAEIDEQTLRDTARDMRDVARSDLFVLMAPDGTVRANVTSDGSTGPAPPPGAAEQVMAGEGERTEFNAAWPLHGQLYLVAGHVVTVLGRSAGILLTGDRIDDRIASKIRRETNTELALITSGHLTAAAIGEHLQAHREELSKEAMRLIENKGDGFIDVAGQRYMAQVARVVGLERKRGDQGPPQAFFVMLRNLDEAMKTYHKIRADLLTLGGAAFAVAILAALVIASTLTRRLAKLAQATALVAGGDLESGVPVGGRDEIGALGRSFNDMIAKLRISREELRTKERLERELEIATVIQTLLLPAQPMLDGYDVAARMVPAEEVGGDFYDLHQTPSGGWVAIGDVSGHGVTPGLIMMMVQSMLAAIARQPSEVSQHYTPKEVLRVINAALYDNLRVRMHDDNYMTMVLLKHMGHGRFLFSGAHESLLIYRRASRQVETVNTDGTWLGVQDDIGPFLQEHELMLEPGDSLLLYTDGVTEAKNGQNLQYNMDRLRDMLIRQAGLQNHSAQKIRDGIIDDVLSWSRSRQDDVTVMVLRRLEASEEALA